MTIGENIRSARIKKGLSQGKLAEILRVDRSLISKWENDKAEPPYYMYPKLSEALDIPEDMFSESKTNVENDIGSMFKLEDIALLLVMVISVLLSPWGLVLSAVCTYIAFKKSLSVWIRILSMVILIVLVYDMFWFYGYSLIPSDIIIK
jgi:transcriptional regulator with XRE-family HTH domain